MDYNRIKKMDDGKWWIFYAGDEVAGPYESWRDALKAYPESVVEGEV